ncbi:TPA: hypothetical protein ACYSGT_006176 [Pseudomonas aeruginosa]
MAALRLAALEGEFIAAGEDLLDHMPPAGETKEERARRLARLRKRKQRHAAAQAKVKAEAVDVPLTLYGGSVAALLEVCKAGEFEEAEEALTLMLHGASDLHKRDPKAFAEFLAPVFAALAVAGADLSKRDRHAFAQLIAPPSRQVVADADA